MSGRRQAKLARSAGASPAQVGPSKPPGSECCVRRRRRRTRSVHSGCVGCVIEPRNDEIAGAEADWAEGYYERLSEMAKDLARRQVTVIVTPPSTAAALAAKHATATIPIVFSVTDDPVKLGLVASLGRPSGNLTGVNFFVAELGAKRLGLLHELLPAVSRVGLLVNPNNANTESVIMDVNAAASAIGINVHIFQARNSHEIEGAFAAFVRDKPDALLVGPDSVF